MSLIVHKYGGTSMGSVERIQNVAKRVAKWMRAGHQVVVVPSAMSGETNRLLGLAKELSANPNPRELDQIASTGEQVSSGLLAIALQEQGVDAVSYAGWQVTVHTDSAFTKARIMGIDDAKIMKDLNAGRAVVITGFQGVDPEGNITTLGRGGSDTSAVAVAAALKADECLIYTMWMGSTPPIHGCAKTHDVLRRSRLKRCWRWQAWVLRSCKYDRSSLLVSTK
jgi:aspartate kinase